MLNKYAGENIKQFALWGAMMVVGLSVGTPIRTSAQENNSSSAPAAKQQDVANLHPAFKYTGEQVTRAIEKATEAFRKGKKFDAIIGKNRQNLHWTLGKGGKSHESFVWNYGLDGITISIEAYRAARLYENVNIPESY